MLTQLNKSSSAAKAQYLLSPLFSAIIRDLFQVAASSGDPDVCYMDTPNQNEKIWRRLDASPHKEKLYGDGHRTDLAKRITQHKATR
ncbi:MAG TPA: hypothetical protein VJW20_13165 [Candidatus Angelobacter sp.]|nr:hypothetical protein [Candidatus Angelobacter sp.]